MLQQGKFTADIVYFYGEDNNITALFNDNLPPIPEGYNFDFVNADALLNLLESNKDLITTPSGMTYRVLALDPNSKYMSLPVLRKIRDMVNEGAIVAGTKPLNTPSLSDDQNEFRSITDQLWANEHDVNIVGRGKVYAGQSLEEVIKSLEIIPDFEYTKPLENTNLLFVHRKLADVDFYWINNRNNRVEQVDASFRVEGKSAEIWHPETGKIEEASYSISDGVTKVPLRLEPNDAVFVVFRNKAKESSYTVSPVTENLITYVDGQWDLSFQPNRGAPEKITLEALSAWNDNADPGVKYFSGTGVYSKTIQAAGEWFNNDEKLWIDLGEVKNLAEAIVNGKSMGILWKRPFRTEITDVLKTGENTFEIRVTNLWVNRLIGDQQPGITAKYTYTTQPFYRADSPLLPSGLLGQVKIVSTTIK